MDQYWFNLLTIILESLVPLVVLAGGVLLLRWAKKQGATDEELGLLEKAYSYLQRAVTSTNQTWVDALKAAEGGLTEEQQAEAREATKKAFEDMITDSIKLAIEAAYGSVEKWLDINLEAAVGQVKNSKTTTEKN